MRNILMSIAAASLVLPAGAVLADPPAHAKAYGKYKNKKHKSRYDDRGRYYEPRRVSRDERIWRGDDGRYHCKRDNGTTGLIIGGAGDRFVPPKQIWLLWQHWQQCALHWFPGNHLIHLDQGRYLKDMRRFLESVSSLTPGVHRPEPPALA